MNSGKKLIDPLPRWCATRMVGLIVVAVFLSVVTGGAWLGLRYLERRVRERTGDSLRIVVETPHESLKAWFDAEREYAEQFARDPQLVQLAKEQTTLPRTRDALLASEGPKDLRLLFHHRGLRHEEQVFALIAPDLSNVFSVRESDVGRRSLIADERPDHLRLAFSGETYAFDKDCLLLSVSRFDESLVVRASAK